MFNSEQEKMAALAKYALFGKMRVGLALATVLLLLTILFGLAYSIIPYIEIIIVRIGAELVLAIVCTCIFGGFLLLAALFQLYNNTALHRIPLFDIFIVSNYSDQFRIWIICPVLAIFIITLRWIVYARIGNIKDFADQDGSIYGAMTLADLGLILVFLITIFTSLNSYALKTKRDRIIYTKDKPVFYSR